MKRARRRMQASSLAGMSPADDARVEALTVAMALAPGVYARNRMFDLFANVGVRRAKSRAATLRGIVRHLVRACALTLERDASAGCGARDPRDPRDVRGQVDFVLRYEIPVMRLTRVVELSRVELAALRLLAERAGAARLLPDDEDRALVETALARLLAPVASGGEPGGEVSPAAR